MTDLQRLFEAAAAALSGRPVRLRWRIPTTAGAAGECFKTAESVVIDIDPIWPVGRRYEMLLHEAAHALLHVDQLETVDDLPSEAVNRPALYWANHPNTPREREANDQAAEWADLANELTTGMLHPNESELVETVAKLSALITKFGGVKDG